MKGFIKINYTAKTEDGEVFDTTFEKVAKAAGLHAEGHKFEAKVIKVGEGQILAGLDKHLSELKIGKHKIILPAEEAFGKKSASLLKLVPTRILKENKITPYVGQPLDIDGKRGIIRVASGGRTIVDFNHPFAGKTVEYDLDIVEEEKDLLVQANAVMKILNVQHEGIEKDTGDGTSEKGIVVLFKEKLPKEFTDILGTELKRLLEVEIKIVKKENPKSK